MVNMENKKKNIAVLMDTLADEMIDGTLTAFSHSKPPQFAMPFIRGYIRSIIQEYKHLFVPYKNALDCVEEAKGKHVHKDIENMIQDAQRKKGDILKQVNAGIQANIEKLNEKIRGKE